MQVGLKKAAVLCILRHEGQLLLLKRTKTLHYGQYVPVGGHIEPFESAREATLREVREETGLSLAAVSYRGILQDTSPTGYNWISYIYSADVPHFVPPECPEGTLEWVDISRIPDLPTPETDRFIYRLVLQGQHFALNAIYDAETRLLLLEDEVSTTVLYRIATGGQPGAGSPVAP